jgi:hypothetical protein
MTTDMPTTHRQHICITPCIGSPEGSGPLPDPISQAVVEVLEESSRASSLEPHETYSECRDLNTAGVPAPRGDYLSLPTIDPLEENFRHSGWTRLRQLTLDSLIRTGCSPSSLDRFCNCGSDCYLQVSEDHQQARLSANYCRSRWCLPCGLSRGRLIANALIDSLPRNEPIRFITLTLKHNDTPLKDQIDRLYYCFNRLRERRSWKTHVTGSACFIEIKVGRDGRWHVHLHVLAAGTFWKQRDLSHEWQCVTGDSSIVDIRMVSNKEDAIRYVAKYVGKPLDNCIYHNPQRLDEAILSLKGRRLCTTTGSFRGIKLNPEPDRETTWITVGRLSHLIERARHEDPQAVRWLSLCLSIRQLQTLGLLPHGPPP